MEPGLQAFGKYGKYGTLGIARSSDTILLYR